MMKNAKKHTVHWLILAALGIFLIIGHNLALNIVTKIIAVALILTAAGGVAGWWKTKSRKTEDIAPETAQSEDNAAGISTVGGHRAGNSTV